MKTAKRRGRLGALFFFVPIVLVVAVIVYAVVAGTASPLGTLVVRAQSSGRYSAVTPLTATVSVGTQRAVTPHNFTLDQGTYTVSFSSLPWYSSPAPRVINVSAGKTAFAVGVYNPSVVAISITANRFNVTRIGALHGVTPVVWLNRMAGPAILTNGPMGGVEIPPSQNFTYVFQAQGTFQMALSNSSSSVSISVA